MQAATQRFNGGALFCAGRCPRQADTMRGGTRSRQGRVMLARTSTSRQRGEARVGEPQDQRAPHFQTPARVLMMVVTQESMR
jgi:hypothetical protein